jgi:hypothetical protein
MAIARQHRAHVREPAVHGLQAAFAVEYRLPYRLNPGQFGVASNERAVNIGAHGLVGRCDLGHAPGNRLRLTPVYRCTGLHVPYSLYESWCRGRAVRSLRRLDACAPIRARAVLQPTSRTASFPSTSSGATAASPRLRSGPGHPLIGYLVDKGLVYRPSRGVVAFTAPMFGAYLRRTEPH